MRTQLSDMSQEAREAFVATPLQRLFERRLKKTVSEFGPAGEEPHAKCLELRPHPVRSGGRIRHEGIDTKTNVPAQLELRP
jgi:septum formation inhibitor MinC